MQQEAHLLPDSCQQAGCGMVNSIGRCAVRCCDAAIKSMCWAKTKRQGALLRSETLFNFQVRIVSDAMSSAFHIRCTIS